MVFTSLRPLLHTYLHTYIYIYIYIHIQGVQKKCLVTTTFNRLKINSTGSKITQLSLKITAISVKYSLNPAPEPDATLTL